MSDKNENKPLGGDAALIVVGLVIAALATTVDLAVAQLLLGVVAAVLLLWVLIRAARKQG